MPSYDRSTGHVRVALVLLSVALGILAAGCGSDGPSLVDNSGNDASNNGVADTSTTTDMGSEVGESDACRGTGCDTSSQNPDPLCDSVDCPGNQYCFRGVCYAPDPLCESTECDAEERCYRGVCEGGCTATADCAEDEKCLRGACVVGDCDEVECADGESCLNGVCYASCEIDDDCPSGQSCAYDACVATPGCDDGILNGTETDTDCGGKCAPCRTDEFCAIDGDCASAVCYEGACEPASCSDHATNGEETDVDCGGPVCDSCPTGSTCKADSDCETDACGHNVCVGPRCSDGRQNGDETDVDCGGLSCGECDVGESCIRSGDCATGVCASGTCTTASCMDSVRNGDETDVDCGGPDCPPCEVGEDCGTGSDCSTGECNPYYEWCVSATCNDAVQNGDESDIDCGGTTCPACPADSVCGDDDDCQSGICSGALCATPTCSDEVQNGTETTTDCGGIYCPGCAAGSACIGDDDCASRVCTGGICAAPTCDDEVRNGDEKGRDCGGGCPGCDIGAPCTEDSDCATNICDSERGVCVVCRPGDVGGSVTSCGYLQRGTRQQVCNDAGEWIDGECQGVWYRSCKEIQDDPNTQRTGFTTEWIDPDGPRDRYRTFPVACDWTTRGGGWTIITRCMARNQLRGRGNVVELARMHGWRPGCRPYTRDGLGNHTYFYTFRFPGGFSQFYLLDYRARAFASNVRSHESDLRRTFQQMTWLRAYRDPATGAAVGDISFGDAASAGPVTSFARTISQGTSCTRCDIPWPEPAGTLHSVPQTTAFRIGWGEAGAEFEGWIPWSSGRIVVK